jgi:hypothetical protein
MKSKKTHIFTITDSLLNDIFILLFNDYPDDAEIVGKQVQFETDALQIKIKSNSDKIPETYEGGYFTCTSCDKDILQDIENVKILNMQLQEKNKTICNQSSEISELKGNLLVEKEKYNILKNRYDNIGDMNTQLIKEAHKKRRWWHK